jgi:hypothetical protein
MMSFLLQMRLEIRDIPGATGKEVTKVGTTFDLAFWSQTDLFM